MKRFLFHFVLVIVGIVIIDVCVGLICKSAVHKNKGLGYNLNYMECDVAIIGGSTAYCHYIPSIIKDSLYSKTEQDLDCYNAGAVYQQLPYYWCAFKGLVDRCHPKFVVIDIQPQQLSGKPFFQAIQNLQPYSDVNNYVKRVCNDNMDLSWKVKNSINMVRYNPIFLGSLGNHLLKSSNENLRSENDGFIGKEGVVEDFTFAPQKDTATINATLMSYMKDIILTAKNKGVNLVFCMSPRLEYVDKESESYLKIVELCESYQIPLWDYSNAPRFKDGHLFYDKIHLNEKGARLFTPIIANNIKTIYQSL